MNYSLIREMDISNGPGVRVSLFCSGCEFHCKNCFNQSTWDFNNGSEFTQHEVDEIITLLKRPYISGLSILGGEPLHPRNVASIHDLIIQVRKSVPDKNIWLWSGFTFDQLNEEQMSCVKDVDVMVDGRFVDELKDFRLKYRGSSNQRVISIKDTIANGKIIEIDD